LPLKECSAESGAATIPVDTVVEVDQDGVVTMSQAQPRRS
jgi:hypothetical protein